MAFDWDELKAIAADGDVTRFPFLENDVTLKEIGVCLRFKMQRVADDLNPSVTA